MTGPEQGFLLLTSTLADPQRKPLTVSQFRDLAMRVQNTPRDTTLRELNVSDLQNLGYDSAMAERIFGLLSATGQLREYLRRAGSCDCHPLTRVSRGYPQVIRRRLGLDSPGVIWAKGDITLLQRPAIAVVGSRDMLAENRKFAAEAGRQVARQGYVLVSGNARGADKTAQEAALDAGGSVISIVADQLLKQPLTRNVLYLSLDDFDKGFSTQRALQRNYVIHALTDLTIAAQCGLGKGGTWDGIVHNARNGWSPVCMFADGSAASEELQNRGIRLISLRELENLSILAEQNPLTIL